MCAVKDNALSWPALRSNVDILQTLVIGIGLCWSIVFLVVALHYELELYADGAMFSYAVAVQDVWAFHWHNISARASVFILTLLPGETYVGLTGNPLNGIRVPIDFVLYRPSFGPDQHIRRRPLAPPNHIHLCLWFHRPALPPGLWLSDRGVAGARTVLANTRPLPICAPQRCWNGTAVYRHACTRPDA